MRDDEYKTSNLYLDSTMLFNRLSIRMQSPEKKIKPFRTSKVQGTGKIIDSPQHAYDKVLVASSQFWAKKHENPEDAKIVNDVNKIVFDMLDEKKNGNVKVEDFCKFLIEIGAPLDYECLFRVLSKIGKEINSDGIAGLCRGDFRSEALLATLIADWDVENKNKKSIKKVNAQALGCVVKKWWKELDQSRFNQVHCNKVSKFLVDKGVTQDFNEAHKFTTANSNGTYFDYSQFQLIFVKSLVKFLLMNIQEKFSIEDWENSDFSNAFKLSQLKRQFYLAGIQCPIPKISLEEGVATLAAIEKYTKTTNVATVKMSYEEFKQTWLELTGNELGKSRLTPDPNLNSIKLTESKNKFTHQYTNRFTLLGNFKLPRHKWSYSFANDMEKGRKAKKTLLLNSQELKNLTQANQLSQFQKLISHQAKYK